MKAGDIRYSTDSKKPVPGGQVVRRHTLDVVTVGSNPTRAAKQDDQPQKGGLFAY